jgi:hypothetical protein
VTAPPAAPSLGYHVLPVYLALDPAVAGVDGGPAVGAVLPVVRDAWARHPALSDKLRLAVTDLGTNAQVRLPLGDPLDLEAATPMPPVRSAPPGGGGLVALRSVIEADVLSLGGEGFLVHRPLLCAVLGTAPDETWGGGLAALGASLTAPVVVLCLFGAAVLDARSPVPSATGAGVRAVFTADPAAPAEVAVAGLAEVVTTVLVRTGHALGAGGSVVLPAADELPAWVTEGAMSADGKQAGYDGTVPE